MSTLLGPLDDYILKFWYVILFLFFCFWPQIKLTPHHEMYRMGSTPPDRLRADAVIKSVEEKSQVEFADLTKRFQDLKTKDMSPAQLKILNEIGEKVKLSVQLFQLVTDESVLAKVLLVFSRLQPRYRATSRSSRWQADLSSLETRALLEVKSILFHSPHCILTKMNRLLAYRPTMMTARVGLWSTRMGCTTCSTR